jgi:hypothetical protein
MSNNNPKIKYNNKIKKHIVSYDTYPTKSKVVRKVEYFYPEEEEKAKKRFDEIKELL